MLGARVLLSVVVAWFAWVGGHWLIAWKGADFVRASFMRDQWSSTGVVGLVVLLAGAALLALATVSLALHWSGLLSVGAVQVVVALVSGFFWSTDLALTIVPEPWRLGVYVQHLYLGVHLALGLVAVGLAVAALVRSRGGGRSVLARLLSFTAVPVAPLAVIPLVRGGLDNMSALQRFGDVSASAVALIVLAAVLLGLSAAAAAASGTGPAAAGALLSLLGFLGLLSPSTFIDVSSGRFGMGLVNLGATGGLFLVGAVLAVGALSVSLAARTNGRSTPSADVPITHQRP